MFLNALGNISQHKMCMITDQDVQATATSLLDVWKFLAKMGIKPGAAGSESEIYNYWAMLPRVF